MYVKDPAYRVVPVPGRRTRDDLTPTIPSSGSFALVIYRNRFVMEVIRLRLNSPVGSTFLYIYE